MRPGHKEIVELLIKAGADVNAKDSFAQAPLHFAALDAHKEIVEELIKAGADPNPPFGGGATLLTQVTMFGNFIGHAQVAKLLVKAGAHVNVKEKDHGATPLHFAIGVCRDKELVELINKAGADVNTKSKDGLLRWPWPCERETRASRTSCGSTARQNDDSPRAQV